MSNILDILNTQDLTSTDLKPKRIKHGTQCVFNVKSVKEVPSKKDPMDKNIEVVVTLANPAPSEKPGENIDPGFQLTSWISLKPIDKNGKDRTEQILREVTTFKLCVTGSKAGAFYPLEQYVGRQVMGTVSVEKDEAGQYADQNRVRFIPPNGVKFE